ncbi:uncharacterized protein LOC9661319 [Selaginella moellendorffii]|uniref:uncharacterized protein LOC9661319 n=1 Tax=Selaginella moellendorffii TaxID=88036 RepID=UPI000D1C337C|nr:uncharacterized protein LOC9661319 [Selaginella moellendorffii]|eukprot:XP_024543449.1 uncharacterized protein LOC9661319 [Selaginella moellendorffii]
MASDEDFVVLLRAKGPDLPKGVLDRDGEGVEYSFVGPRRYADGKSLLEYLGDGQYYVAREHQGRYGWQELIAELQRVPRVADCIHVFEKVARREPITKGLLQKFGDKLSSVVAVVQRTVRSKPITKDVVEAILQTFGDDLSDSISSMTPAHAFKRKFSLTKVPICQINVSGRWQPSLLWHGLEQPLGSRDILSLLRISNPSLLILFDVSGAGKTRCLYEIAAQQTCLYFTGVCSGSPTADGSRDLLVVSETLQRLYPTGPIPVSSLKTCLRAVLLSRLFIHRKCDDLLKPLSNLTFLFKQVMHQQLNYTQADPWAHLTGCILALATSVDDLPALESVLSKMLRAYTWDWPIILDECQEVNRYLKDRFMAGDGETGSLRRSMLDKFVIALQDAGFNNKVIFAGTGRSLYHVATHISETMKFRVSIYWYTTFGEFRDGQALRQYASNILEDCSIIDFERLGVLYRGRYRTFVTALEQYILFNPPATAATEFFLNYAKETTSMRGVSWTGPSKRISPADIMNTVNRTVLDDVYRFFSGVPSDELAAVKALVQSVVANHFFGTGKMVVMNPTLSLVEFGLGRVQYKGHRLMKWMYQHQDGIIGHSDTSEKCRAVEIFEPLVCRALWHYYQENSSLQRIQQHRFLEKAEIYASATGEVYETAVAEMIGEHLDGRCLADLFSSWNTEPIPSIYNNTATLARPKIDNQNLIGTETEDFRLIDWINSVTSGKDNFFTFFSTGMNKTCGPDIWWFLTVTEVAKPAVGEHADKLQCTGVPVTTFIICAAQLKTLQKMAMGDYVSSLDFNKLFLHKGGQGYKLVVKRKEDEEGAKRVRELARFGCLKLVVMTDFVDLMKFQPKVQHAAKLEKLNTHCEQEQISALLGVIDGTNICMFDEEWLIDSVKQCN